jgi:hypothetical protein
MTVSSGDDSVGPKRQQLVIETARSRLNAKVGGEPRARTA